MSKKLKFKVGDQVRITGDRHIGEVGVISRVKGDRADSECTLRSWDYEVKFDKKLEYTHRGNRGTGSMVYYYYNEHNLELVPTGTKYKPGDMVTVRDDLDRWSIYHMADGKNPMEATEQMLSKCGKVVKIKSVTKTGKYMIEGSIFPWVDEMFEDKLETKVKPKTDTDKSPRFKVGDKVKHRYHSEFGVGTVFKVKSSVYEYDVIWSNLTDGHDGDANDSSTNHWYVLEDNIIPASGCTEKREPKVGDRIRMTSNWCEAKVGMVGTIINISMGTVDVRFDVKFPGGHSCSGKCEAGFGHNVLPKHFEIIGEEKPHLICSVKFTENGKLYCYLTDDATITVGSEVKVPVGKTDREKTATVERIGYYTEADAPYTVSEMKKVIGKATPTFDWEAFKNTKIIVKLDTKEKLDAFMKECEKHGVHWSSGQLATEHDAWGIGRKIITIVYGLRGNSGMTHASLEYHVSALPDAVVYDYKLPESKPEVKPEPNPEPEKKHKFKVGDKVRAITNDYAWTVKKYSWEGEVTKVKDEEFCAKTTRSTFRESEIGREYHFLDYDNFELIKEEPKYYNGKVVCVETKPQYAYTVGKVYEAVDGQIKIDNGWHQPILGAATSVDDLNEKLSGFAKFVEFKG